MATSFAGQPFAEALDGALDALDDDDALAVGAGAAAVLLVPGGTAAAVEVDAVGFAAAPADPEGLAVQPARAATSASDRLTIRTAR
jgi:hypothetical protein